VAHSSGTVLIYVLPASVSASGVAGLSVSTTSSVGVVRVAGVVPSSETLNALSWGRLQVFGYHPSIQIGVTTSTGDALVTSSTAGVAGVETIANSTTTVGADFGVFATTLQTATSSTTVQGFIRVK
jgi:hypothetical protein